MPPLPEKTITEILQEAKEHEDVILSFQGSLVRIPAEIGNLEKLQKFYLTDAKEVKELPPQIEHLGNLTSIHITHCGLEYLPAQIGRLTKLEGLHLSMNELQEIPREIGYLKNLKKLDLAGNKLTTLPDTLEWLDSLEELDLSGNNLGQNEKLTGKELKDLINIMTRIPNKKCLISLNYNNFSEIQAQQIHGAFQNAGFVKIYVHQELPEGKGLRGKILDQ